MPRPVKACPVGTLRNARGEVIRMDPGPCLFCGEWVEEGRDLAGCTLPLDPAWNVDGDFGCSASPESNDDGVGDHLRPFDVARLVLGIGLDGKPLRGERNRHAGGSPHA